MQTDSNLPTFTLGAVVLDCSDAGVMAEFYTSLLGWTYTHPHQNGWAAITSPTGQVLAFQEDENFLPPVWPSQAGKPGQMLHIDWVVDDLEAGVAHALACGARMAPEQYFRTSRSMLDPSGHPFCVDTLDEE